MDFRYAAFSRTETQNTNTHYVTIYWSEVIDVRKTAENTATDSVGSNFSSAAFCLSYNLGGILLSYLAVSKRVSARPSDQDTLRITDLARYKKVLMAEHIGRSQ